MRIRILVLVSAVLLHGCSYAGSKLGSVFADNLTDAITGNPDIETVREGLPAYLIMVDSFISDETKSPGLLQAAAILNGSYASGFVADVDRQLLLTEKSLQYALRAGCSALKWMCSIRTMTYDELRVNVANLRPKHVPVAYTLASSWAGWIQARSEDWSAIGELARVKILMVRVNELDELYDNGGPPMYLGVFETLLPPAYGGRPELGREYFERAIEISQGRFLYAKVLFAENYARMVYDRELHDRLLSEVIDEDPVEEGMTLQNSIAQQRARALLEESDEVF